MTDAVVVICTRRESSRLPGKALRRIAGRPAIEHILQRLKPTGLDVILAVPERDGDAFLSAAVKNLALIRCGNDESPLHRMADAMIRWCKPLPKYVVRITHDDILIDAQTVTELLAVVEREGAGYGITPDIVDGAGVEVIHTANLMWAAEHIKEPVEHISYYVRGDCGVPMPKIVRHHPRMAVQRPYRLTMDYPEDAAVLEAVLGRLGPDASVDNICSFLDQNPWILAHNKLPEVSLYTCARNAAATIRATLESVVDVGDEYVVVEDASTDDTLLKILGAKALGQRMRLIVNEENLGLASSSNVALKACRGRYVMRVDADDKVKPGALWEMKQLMQRTGAAIVYADYTEIDEHDQVVRHHAPAAEHHHAGCALMDARLINELRFREGLRHWDSLELYNRVQARFPIAYVGEPLWFYRVRRDSMSHQDTPERRRALASVMGHGISGQDVADFERRESC